MNPAVISTAGFFFADKGVSEMANRAERRAQAKANRRGVPSQYDQTHGRGRSGMIDEYQLQQKSQRLQDGTDGTEWKPAAVRLRTPKPC